MNALHMLACIAVAGFALAGCLGEPADPPRKMEWTASYMAQALLCPSAPRTILLEIDFEPGVRPDPGAVSDMVSTLTAATGRPVRVVGPSEVAPAGADHDRNTVYEAHLVHADHVDPSNPFAHADSSYLHVLYLAGPSKDHRFLGTFVQGPFSGVAAVLPYYWTTYTPLVHSHGLGIAGPLDWRFERAVLIHEVGHALGLVNKGTPMVADHADPDAPGHSANPESVMYTGDHHVLDDPETWLREKGVEPAWTFDDADHADMAAMRDGSSGACPNGG